LAKHLKKKDGGLRLFSTKQPKAAAPAQDETRPETEPEDSFGDIDIEPTELDSVLTDIPAPEDFAPEAGRGRSRERAKKPEHVRRPEPAKKPEHVQKPERVQRSAPAKKPEPEKKPGPENKPESEKEPEQAVQRPADGAPARYSFAPGRSVTRIYMDKRSARRVIAAVGIVAALAILVLALVKTGALKGGSSDPTAADYVFSPKCVDSTKPDKLITETDVMVNDNETGSYTAAQGREISFPSASSYTAASGVLGFRGNNFRDTASYGTADITGKTLTAGWSVDTGTLEDADGNSWSGSGWTGQPIIVSWPDAAKKNMKSMYDWAREKSGLVEAIYPTMDGKIYFLELATGKATRDPMDLGYTFKGTGALDPRGYPILYIGSGVDSKLGKSRVFVINLLDDSVMYTFGYYEPFAQRNWNMWDASPLVDAATDQLIYPGENGVLYIVHLNTLYDESAGTVTVSPDDTVRWRYTSSRTTTYTFWGGFEASPVCYQGHIIMADNGGNLMCLDLNTLKLDWVQNVLDDTNASPVLSVEKDGVYVYIGTSFHPGWRSEDSAIVPVWKINAETGEVVWETDFACTGDNGLCGGLQGTIAIGKNKLSGLIFVPVACTPDSTHGTLAALDCKTGKQVWKFDTDSYSWSSPADVYDAAGNGYLLYCTSDGTAYLLDGLTGAKLSSAELGGNIEASPAVYNSWAAVGTRGGKIFGLKLG
jgi:plastocyanin